MPTKADYVNVNARRMLPFTKNEINKMKIADLRELFGEFTFDEEYYLAEIEARRVLYPGDVNYNASMYNLPDNLTKARKLDYLMNLPVLEKYELSPEQTELVNGEQAEMSIVSAGPGSGKTSTLVNWVKSAYLRDESVLVLMFGVDVEEQFIKRLKACGVKVVPRPKLCVDNSGVFVMTFDKYVAIVNKIITGYIFTGNYCESFMRSLQNIVSDNFTTNWDYLMIDESQDMLKRHFDLIQTITRKNTVFAGDCRQQVFTEAGVFRKLLSDSEFVRKLTYNFRSTREIVNVLNCFSSSNFHESADIQQECDRISPGSVIIVRGDEAELVTKYISEMDEGSTFAVSPVTTNKYHMDKTVDTIRQKLFLQTGRRIRVAREKCINPEFDYILNSINVKGLEREQVVLFGVSNTLIYNDYSVSMHALKCLLFVAMSRAKSRLVIVINDREYASPNLLDPILRGNISLEPKSKYKSKRNSRSVSVISVTDLANLTDCNIEHLSSNRREFSPVSISRDGLEDCVGHYVEAQIANGLGILENKYLIRKVRGQESAISYLLGGVYSFAVNCGRDELVELEKIFKRINESDDTAQQKYVTCHYVAKIQSEWTLSDCLGEILVDTSLFEEEIVSIANESLIKHQSKTLYAVPIDRSDKIAGYIDGVMDFEYGDGSVEIKHAKDSPIHRKQTAIYQKLTGKKATLINTLCGFAEDIQMNEFQFDHYVRSVLVMRDAFIYRTGSVLDARKGGIIISIDTEYGMFPDPTNICEIGAIAWNSDTSEIVGVYQKTEGCFPCDKPKTQFEKLTGLRLEREIIGEFDDFLEWVDKWPGATFMHWGGGNDTKLLGNRCGSSFDLMKMYKLHLSRASVRFPPAKECKLSEAVDNLFPPGFTWEPHRAFEDAVMTLGIYRILTSER